VGNVGESKRTEKDTKFGEVRLKANVHKCKELDEEEQGEEVLEWERKR